MANILKKTCSSKEEAIKFILSQGGILSSNDKDYIVKKGNKTFIYYITDDLSVGSIHLKDGLTERDKETWYRDDDNWVGQSAIMK